MMCRDISMLCLVTFNSHRRDECTTAYCVNVLSFESHSFDHDGVLMRQQYRP